MKVKSESEVAQSGLTLSDLMACSLPGSSIHGISQARVLEWGAIAFSYLLLNKVNFHSNPKERQCQRMLKLLNNCSHLKVMLKILQARLQQYLNHELPDVQAGFRKGRETRDQIANIRWIIEKARVPEKHLFLLY